MTILEQCRSCTLARISWDKVYCGYEAETFQKEQLMSPYDHCNHHDNTIYVDPDMSFQDMQACQTGEAYAQGGKWDISKIMSEFEETIDQLRNIKKHRK